MTKAGSGTKRKILPNDDRIISRIFATARGAVG
jgi:hypothetical protein